ncbi:S41 family peptidase [Mucilaginibacter sp. FT3.2]|uniref:S41 family peptidase n=1 Tax=Mucilaginibacter sp. FT3.2 TaxID=2723090 RepID=UPI00161D52B2|nr:S41 family peptidase [Mucilaginibacter sp. FT3.2]MBB6233761.1 C-terminal processing protease CtpA/Prc [Mucilaginibacter sp. FT3.2]
MKHSLIILVLLSSIGLKTRAQVAVTPGQAYENAQNMRAEARKFYDKDKPIKSECDSGIAVLSRAISYLDKPQVTELAQGSLYLKGRKSDVYYDMMICYTLSNQYDKALDVFEKISKEGDYYRISSYETDSLFIPMRSNPRFQATLKGLKLRRALWKDESLKTTYRDNLSDAEKAAGLSILWSQAKYNFANFNLSGIDWDKTYLDYLALVKNTTSTAQYYKVLQQFYAQLKDGHSNVYPPKELFAAFYTRPPFRTELIEGRVFVTQIFSDSLKNAGITPGTEILSIDGQPVLTYGKTQVAPYQSSSTPQDMDIRTYTYALLAGPATSPIRLQLRSSKGKTWQQDVARTGYRDVKNASPSIEFKQIGQIGYLTVNNFEDEKIMKQFDSLFTQISATKGLIIDIRNNGGGSSGIGYHIIASLTNKPFKTSYSKTPRYIPSINGIQWNENTAEDWDANGKQYYDKPVVVLISARTFSAAEDFTVAFDYMKRGKLIGQTTGGSTGQPFNFSLPGGGSARICSKHDAYPDGKEFVGVGIAPDVMVTKTVKDLRNGKDAALENALRLLNK